MKQPIYLSLLFTFLLISCKSEDFITNFKLESNQIEIWEGDSIDLALKLTTDAKNPLYLWKSLSPEIATIKDGIVKGLSSGTTKIKVSLQANPTFTDSCIVIVKQIGTSDRPYLIYTVNDLKKMRDRINNENAKYGSKSYKLMNDIDLTKEANWTPIGKDEANSFNGVFDGNGKVIKNIIIKYNRNYKIATQLNYFGIFGYISGGLVQNTGVSLLRIGNDACNYVGGIAGYIRDGIIRDCFIENSTITSDNKMADYEVGIVQTGSIAGSAVKSSIYNCRSSANINSETSGGIVGTAVDGIICNCLYTGTINSYCDEPCVGGISGNGGKIYNCYSTSNMVSHSYLFDCYAGGVAGKAHNIENCYSSGGILSEYGSSWFSYQSYAGGIAGSVSNACIIHCIALNTMITSASNVAHVARIANWNYNTATFKSNYAKNNIAVKLNSSVITDFSDTKQHGQDLVENPVDFLNKYVTDNPTINGIPLKKWVVKTGVNNGYPVFE